MASCSAGVLDGPVQVLEIRRETGWYVEFKVHNKSIRFLVDSGASCSFIDIKVWNSLKHLSSELEAVKEKFILADSTPLTVLGSVELQLGWGRQLFQQQIIVADLGGGPAILGLDFLERYDAVLHLSKGKMRIRGRQILLSKEGDMPRCTKVTCEDTFSIPEYSSVWVNVAVDYE